MAQDETDAIKILEKEIRVLKKKLSICMGQRDEMQTVMEQSRKLLENVLEEETLNQRNMFRKFVPKELLQTLEKKNILDIQLGDHVEREMTILFSDIRSFTTLSESMSSQESFNFINAFLKRVEPPINRHNGFIDKFIGDAIMALFYTPDEAIDAGINMQKALRIYNDSRVKKSFSPIKIGIGLHTGSTIMGIIGVETRLQGTVIADAVNIAQRMENMTKYYHSALLITSYTLSKIQKLEKYRYRHLGRAHAAGKKELIDIYEILDAEDENTAELKFKSKKNVEDGLKLFFERNFAEASVEFTKALKLYPKDNAADVYLKLSAEYMIHPVPEDWDGSIVHVKG